MGQAPEEKKRRKFLMEVRKRKIDDAIIQSDRSFSRSIDRSRIPQTNSIIYESKEYFNRKNDFRIIRKDLIKFYLDFVVVK